MIDLMKFMKDDEILLS